jgi:hypothetical protein
MTMSDEDDSRDHAIILLTVCVVLLTANEMIENYRDEQNRKESSEPFEGKLYILDERPHWQKFLHH